MDLSIVIVNWNTSELLLQCLDSISRAKPALEHEIIVVDNGSTDNSVTAVSLNFPSVRIICNKQNLGFAKANNLGLAEARGRYFLLLNSDTLIVPGAFERLTDLADKNPEVGVVGPKLLNMDGTLQKSWGIFPTLLFEVSGRINRMSRSVESSPFTYDVDWLGGACLMVRSKAAFDAGMLDEDYFMYSEETDWCYRIKKRGWKIWYLTNAEVYHLGGGSADKVSLIQLLRLYESKILFFRKHYGEFQATLLRYGLAISKTLGLFRRVLVLRGKDKKAIKQRLSVQAKLILCLLRNQFSTSNR